MVALAVMNMYAFKAKAIHFMVFTVCLSWIFA